MKHVYGIVPSRRLGQSLGVSPIPFKTCNYSCVYCQLGRTNHMTNERQTFFPPDEIIDEFYTFVVKENVNDFDVVSIVGEGEPLLYKPLRTIVNFIKKVCSKKVVLITNGSLFYDEEVRREVQEIDIIMPTLDAWDEDSFKTINRPHGKLSFDTVYNGLLKLKEEFPGQIWLEVMLVKGINDSVESLEKIREKIQSLEPDRVYVNVPVRPPAEPWVEKPSQATIEMAKSILGASAIENYAKGAFKVEPTQDDLDAIISIVKRHPMREKDIRSFLKSRGKRENECSAFLSTLANLDFIEKCAYEGDIIYRFKSTH